MARKRIRDIRNEEFIQATIATVYEKGYSRVTLADIARHAGSSAASISYYFGSKEGLMEATMRHLLNQLRDAMVDGYAQADSPHAKLYAVMDANFSDELYTVAQCSIWMQFWANAPYFPNLARLHQINRSRVESHFVAEISRLLPDDQVETACQTLQGYMDGVWLQAAQSDAPLNAARARQNAHRVVDLVISNGSQTGPVDAGA